MSKRRTSMSRMKTKQLIFIATLMALPVIHYLVFWVYVNAQTIALSFQRFNIYTGKFEWYGLRNYIVQWQDVYMGKNVQMHNALLNSFNVWGINAIILPLAIIVSYAFYKNIPGERIFRVVLYMPHMISVTALTLCYRYLFENNANTFIGPMAAVFNSFGLNIDWWNVVDKSNVIWPLIYAYHIWFGLGSNIILISSAMNRIPKEICDAGKLDGLGFWRELVSVTIPLVMPTVGTFILTSLTGVMSYGMVPMLLIGAETNGGSYGQAYAMGWYMFNVAKAGDAQLAAATAIGIIFSVFMMPLVVIVRKLINKKTADVQY